MDSRRDRTGFVSELPDDRESCRASGLFAAHWESNADRGSWGPGPDGVPVAEAIEWARRHATRVSVLFGDGETLYSAGEEDFPDDDLPRWPEEGMVVRARPIDTPLDGSVQEIPWQVVGHVNASAELDDEAVARLRTTLEGDDRVLAVSVETGGDETLVHCQVRARGMSTAVLVADGLIEDALEAAMPGSRGALTSTAGIGPAL
jgi:hypothetical protein